MIRTHRGTPIPLEIYHGVPKGWRADEVVATHAALGGHSPELRRRAGISWAIWRPSRDAVQGVRRSGVIASYGDDEQHVRKKKEEQALSNAPARAVSAWSVNPLAAVSGPAPWTIG
ncbi:MAG: hypothetical protein V7606_4680, partial [Burkholderiales bacterium]